MVRDHEINTARSEAETRFVAKRPISGVRLIRQTSLLDCFLEFGSLAAFLGAEDL